MNLQQGSSDRFLRIGWWVLFGLAVGVVVLIRIRLLEIPLERDEGEYAYTGQLMLQGVPPYMLAYSMKFPGTAAAYALIMLVFGQTTVAVHLGLLVLNMATVALIFFLGRRLFDEVAGIAAGATYAILSVSPTVLGSAAHASHFVVFAAVSGALLLLSALDRGSKMRLFLAGTAFGAAVLMKQPGVAFLFFGAIYLLFYDWKNRGGLRRTFLRLAIFLFGGSLPLLVTCFLLWRLQVFGKFWFWSIRYASLYGSTVSLPLGARIFASKIGLVIGANWALWAIAEVGLFIGVWRARSALNHLFVVIFALFSASAVCAGLYFREHYFVLAFPALALLVGMVASHVMRLRQQRLSWVRVLFIILFAVSIGLPLVARHKFLFSAGPDLASRLIYGANPFPESVPIASFLRERTKPGDTIAVLGSEPQIYFYSHRRSATGYIYMYALMEPQPFATQMQREMIKEIEAAHPKYLVFVAVPASWLKESGSNDLIFNWLKDYSSREFEPTGLVNMVSPDRTDYYLPYKSEPVTPSRCRIAIYKRKL